MPFKKEDLINMLLGKNDTLLKITENVLSSTDSAIGYECIFLDVATNRNYRLIYIKALYQRTDEMLDYEDSEVECEEVVLKETLVKKWVLKGSET